MLKWAAKNKSIYISKKNTNVEIRIKLINSFLIWFLTRIAKKGNFFYSTLTYYNVFNGMVFLKKLIRLSKLILVCHIEHKERLLFSCITITKILTCIARMHKFICLHSQRNMLLLYRNCLIFFWFLNNDVKNYNLSQKFVLFKILNKHTLAYIYNTISYARNIKFSFSKIKAACFVTGRSRAVVRAFKLSRFKIREFANLGFFIGLTKSSW
jgi:ribosomal protein S14